MPQYTVAGRLTADEMELIIVGVYQGSRPGKVPVGGWGHVLDAPDRAAARRMALETFGEYTDGMLVYEIEFEVQPARGGLFGWLPWRTRRQTSGGSLPIV